MSYLYLDTTDHLIVGLLTDDYSWCEFNETPDTKTSHLMYPLIVEILKRHKLEPQELSGLIHVSGPGSYTGMRLSEGMAQIFSWQGIPCRSFYHFEIPQLLAEKEGCWVAKAYKGEYFLCYWGPEEVDNREELIDREKLISKLIELKNNNIPVYTHFLSSLNLDKNGPEFFIQETGTMLKNKSKEIFAQMETDWPRHRPFYFRVLEQEFRRESPSRYSFKGQE
ncbi:MAG: hypothetical protein WCG27_05860 [Pseudomonadota bacterium]